MQEQDSINETEENKKYIKTRRILLTLILLGLLSISYMFGVIKGLDMNEAEYNMGYEKCLENENLIEDKRIPIFLNVTDNISTYVASLYIEEELK